MVGNNVEKIAVLATVIEMGSKPEYHPV